MRWEDYDEKEQKRIERYLNHVLNELKRVFEDEFPEYKDDFEIVYGIITESYDSLFKKVMRIPFDRLPTFAFFLGSKSNPKKRYTIFILHRQDLTKREAKVKDISRQFGHFGEERLEKIIEKIAGDKVFRRGLKERITSNKADKKVDDFVTLYYREGGALFKGINWDSPVVFFYHNLDEGEAFLIIDKHTSESISLLKSLIPITLGEFEENNSVNFSYFSSKGKGCDIKLLNKAIEFMKKSGMFKDIKFATFLRMERRLKGKIDLTVNSQTIRGQGYLKKHVHGIKEIFFGKDKYNPLVIVYVKLR